MWHTFPEIGNEGNIVFEGIQITLKNEGAVLDNAKMCYRGWHEEESIKLVQTRAFN